MKNGNKKSEIKFEVVTRLLELIILTVTLIVTGVIAWQANNLSKQANMAAQQSLIHGVYTEPLSYYYYTEPEVTEERIAIQMVTKTGFVDKYMLIDYDGENIIRVDNFVLPNLEVENQQVDPGLLVNEISFMNQGESIAEYCGFALVEGIDGSRHLDMIVVRKNSEDEWAIDISYDIDRIRIMCKQNQKDKEYYERYNSLYCLLKNQDVL